MKWNVRSAPSGEMKWNERFTSLFTSGCEMKINEIILQRVSWNEVKFMKFMKFMKFSETSETRLWEATTRFIEFYQKSVFVKLSVFQT